MRNAKTKCSCIDCVQFGMDMHRDDDYTHDDYTHDDMERAELIKEFELFQMNRYEDTVEDEE